jgi:short subunit dehydrogenase-like uncharacterized protein
MGTASNSSTKNGSTANEQHQGQVDYLDITVEINVYRLAERLGAEAASNHVMLLPGVGWDVVPTDSLAVHVAKHQRPSR